jgi:hypothetical protein
MATDYTGRQKGLNTAQPRLLGEIPQNYTNQYPVTKAAEDAFNFGSAVMSGTAANQVKLFANATGPFEGVAMLSGEGRKVDANDAIIGYNQYDAAGILKTGYVVVYVNEAVTPASPVRVYHTIGAGSEAVGTFATTAEAGKTSLLTGAKFAGTTTAAGNVALFLDDSVSKTATADV